MDRQPVRRPAGAGEHPAPPATSHSRWTTSTPSSLACELAAGIIVELAEQIG
jgi:hypothetical protein